MGLLTDPVWQGWRDSQVLRPIVGLLVEQLPGRETEIPLSALHNAETRLKLQVWRTVGLHETLVLKVADHEHHFVPKPVGQRNAAGEAMFVLRCATCNTPQALPEDTSEVHDLSTLRG